MPHATAPGRHGDAIGTKSSGGPKYTKLSAHERGDVHRRRTPTTACRGTGAGRASTPATPLPRISRVESASPHRMLAVTTAHAISPDERADVPRQLRVDRRDGATITRPPRSTRPSSRNTHACTPVARASDDAVVDARDHDRLRDPFGPPRVGRGRDDRDHRRARRSRRCAGSMMWCTSAPAARPRPDPARARHERRVGNGMHERGAARVERILHGNAPGAVGRLAAGAHVAAEAHEHAPRAAVDQARGDEVGRETLADAAEIDANAGGKRTRARGIDVDLDPREARRAASGRTVTSPSRLAGRRPRTSGRNPPARARRESSGRTARSCTVQIGRAGEREEHRRAHIDPRHPHAFVEMRELAVGTEAAPTLFEPFDLRERPRVESGGRVADHDVRRAPHCTRPALGPVAVGAPRRSGALRSRARRRRRSRGGVKTVVGDVVGGRGGRRGAGGAGRRRRGRPAQRARSCACAWRGGAGSASARSSASRRGSSRRCPDRERRTRHPPLVPMSASVVAAVARNASRRDFRVRGAVRRAGDGHGAAGGVGDHRRGRCSRASRDRAARSRAR